MRSITHTPVTLRHADPFDIEVLDAIKAHAVECYPDESCGLVLRDGDSTWYRPCTNVHSSPEKAWEIGQEEILEAMEGKELLAVVHSHPNGPNYPSLTDQEQQLISGDTWGIVPVHGTNVGEEIVPIPSDIIWWGDKLPMPPLKRRRFIWGVFHCYQLYRDWIKQEWGVVIPAFPCSIDFVKDGYSIFLDNCEQAGLRNLGKVDMSELQVGDMLVGHLRGDFPNHCGVYLGGDDFLHHPQDGVSGEANLLRWWPHIDTVFRYDRTGAA